MPCPRCGNRVGRDDGDAIITCDDRTTCRSSWTEREYQFLAGLITRERLDMEILKWLLAEAYWRLDKIRTDIDIAEMVDTMDMPGVGRILADAITNHLDGHKLAPDRVIATDRQATETRQHDEDNWNWRNETPYRPPKLKPTKPVAPPTQAIHPGSLTTLVDIDADTILNGDARCPECNCVHSGECP
jgi:hypothetical protein